MIALRTNPFPRAMPGPALPRPPVVRRFEPVAEVDVFDACDARLVALADVAIPSIAKIFGVPPRLIWSRHRHRRVSVARQMAMLVVREAARASYPELGRVFRRDHSTIMHGVAQADALLKDRPRVAARVAAIRTDLKTRFDKGEFS